MLVQLSDQLCLFVACKAIAGVIMYHLTGNVSLTVQQLHLSIKHQHFSLVSGLFSRVPELRQVPEGFFLASDNTE